MFLKVYCRFTSKFGENLNLKNLMASKSQGQRVIAPKSLIIGIYVFCKKSHVKIFERQKKVFWKLMGLTLVILYENDRIMDILH
jgi:hypothetical protein